MGAPVIVPRSLEAWPQEPNFRVEYWNSEIASRCVLYFTSGKKAMSFAAEHTLAGVPCVVECKTMRVSHTVSKYSLPDPDYVFWTKRFGNYSSARDEFERGKDHAQANGGGYRMQNAAGKGLAQYENWKD